ncbi:TPA: imidazoleglycerol-phosphate dehydratase HisB [Candidatus Poribacteria bacterium]|nr:imidazoleglycerol-phosphate dehydratase HisB [Candidatus Poribacteria bacterium]
MTRTAQVERETGETKVRVKLSLDGEGRYDISTGIGFLDHMLHLFAKHGLFDLELRAEGDLHVDYHHTVEDVGICLGEAVSKALGDRSGIRRFGFFILPMFESLAIVSLDVCGRGFLSFNAPDLEGRIGDFDSELVEEFFNGFVGRARVTMHVLIQHGSNRHHMVEAIFKAFAKALDMATQIDERIKDVPSTKGVLV